MGDPTDPTDLAPMQQPAFVYPTDGADPERDVPEYRFVANVMHDEIGWVTVRHWDGREVKYPAHSIRKIEHVGTETERDGDGLTEQVSLASEPLIDRARRLGGESE